MRLIDLLIVHARVSAPREPLVGSSDHRDDADTTQSGIIKGCRCITVGEEPLGLSWLSQNEKVMLTNSPLQRTRKVAYEILAPRCDAVLF